MEPGHKLDVNASASKLQAAFRGFKQRRFFHSIARKMQARNSFAVEHDLLTKRLEQKLHINEALKRAATEKVDPSREAMMNAAVAIQRAWKRSNSNIDSAQIKMKQLQFKTACVIQRAVRKWRTARAIKEKPEEPNNEFGDAAYEYMETPASFQVPAEVVLPPQEDNTYAERLISRSRELRARLEDPPTIFGAASKSLLPKARDQVAELLRLRKFHVPSEYVTSADKELLLRLAN